MPAAVAPKPEASAAPPAAGAKALSPELQKAMSKVTEISSLPEITTKIVAVVENPSATAHDMHEIVKTDPALATKVLKVVNSAFYGLPSQIASLDRAIVMLGLSAVKNIALAASLSRMFKGDALSSNFSLRDLWRHCIGVGVCAKMLAKVSKAAATDELFVGGLVHDMGLLVMQQLFPDKLRMVADKCFKEPLNFCEAERQTIGADHEAFGLALATKWKFPPLLRNAIAYHHDAAALQADYQRPVAIITIADTLVAQQQIGFWLTTRTQTLTPDLLKRAVITDEQLKQVSENLKPNVEDAEKVFS